jgi:hypothetical protein
VISTEHKLSSFLQAGENILVGDLFPRFFRNTFPRYRVIRQKNEEKYQRGSLPAYEKNQCKDSMKNAQFFNDWVDQ